MNSNDITKYLFDLLKKILKTPPETTKTHLKSLKFCELKCYKETLYNLLTSILLLTFSTTKFTFAVLLNEGSKITEKSAKQAVLSNFNPPHPPILLPLPLCYETRAIWPKNKEKYNLFGYY